MKENKAITLIALVVTIVVILILSSVSLNLVLGEHGIITMAKKAKENMELAQVEEETKLNTLYEQLYRNSIGESGESGNGGNTDNTQGGETEKPNPPVETPKTVEDAKKMEDGYFKEETTLEDSDGNHLVIPAGFKIAEDSGNNVTEGIVIEDNDILARYGEGRGNQYVWIPVSNIDGTNSNPIKKNDGNEIKISLARYTFNIKGVYSYEQGANHYETATTLETYFQELKDARIGTTDYYKGTNTTALNLKGFIDSVKQNGGYYIARYEASYGTDGKANSKISDYCKETTNFREGDLWRNITQLRAAEASREIYKNNNTVTTDLINSYAWDTAIYYIQKFSNKETYSRQEPNYKFSSLLYNTGKCNDEVCKINDMSSNFCEWTTEYSICKTGGDTTNAPCVRRGGCQQYGYYTSSRHFAYSNSQGNYQHTTFRVILYLNNLKS